MPYLVPVDSATDQTAENFTYTITLTADQMQAALTETLGLAPDGHSAGTLVWAANPYRFRLCSQHPLVGAERHRAYAAALSWTAQHLLFNRMGDGNFTVTTQGYGHGVGLSQWGAKALAEQGASCQEILAHYFPHTELRE